jgi:uncharacterized integral membrane protein
MKILAFLIIGITIASAALFSVQNASIASLRFLVWRSIELPLGFLLCLGFVGGLLLAVFGILAWQLTAIYGDNDEVAFADHSVFNNNDNEEWD